MLVSMLDLWLPIVLAGVLCWIASALIHMLLKYHNSDYSKLENEADVSVALGAASPKPALYSLPHCNDMKEMGDEAMQKKFAAGPVAMIAVLPNGMPALGKLLIQQFLFFIVGSLLIAYLTALVFGVGAAYMPVFRFVAVAAFLTYGWAQVPYSVWMGQPWSNTVRYLIDALIYAAVTAGTFAWLWPELS